MKYSNDFQFFKDNQVFVTFTNGRHKATICSRLEAVRFREIYSHPEELTDEDIEKRLKSIHESLIQQQ